MEDVYLFHNIDKAKVDEIVDQLNKSKSSKPGLVFNYPPISVWDQFDFKALSPEQLWNNSNKYSFNIYIHIPFCRQKCSYCYYSIKVHKDWQKEEEMIWEYLKCLEKEVHRYLPFLKDKKVNTVFIGGGTPSRLSIAQIRFLFDNIIRQFDLSECEEITFESSADSLTHDKIAVLKDYLVNRISMGVQTFDADFLKKSNRDTDLNTIYSVYNSILKLGIPVYNLDIIAGIENETEASMNKTLENLVKLEKLPSQITLFTLNIRKGSSNYAQISPADQDKSYENSLLLYKKAKDFLLNNGYWQFSRNLFPRDNNVFKYQRNIWGHNGYVLALGASGYSHTQNYVYLNEYNVGNYLATIRNDQSAVEKGYFLSAEESIRRYLVLAFKHKVFNKGIFNTLHRDQTGLSLNNFNHVFSILNKMGIIEENAEEFIYTENGINECDRYVRMFYSDKIIDIIEEQIADTKPKNSDAFSYVL